MYDQLETPGMKHGNILRFYDNRTWAWSMECFRGSHVEKVNIQLSWPIYFCHSKMNLFTKQDKKTLHKAD